ncbi:MAG: PIN domain-containing protein [Patescibacteria group bacterium]
MTILDSSVWIAWLDKDDSQHGRAEKVFEQVSDIVVPEYVILEVCTVLSRKKGHAFAEQFLSLAVENSDITILLSSEDLFYKTVDSFKKVFRRRLSFADSMLAVLSRSYTILTFDNTLQKAIQEGYV